MFKLLKSNRVFWPVTITEPVDGGTTLDHKCEIQFEIQGQDIFDALAKESDIKLLKTVVKGWKKIGVEGGEEGAELEFTQANLDAMLQTPYVRTAFIRGYVSAASGAAAKN